MKSSHKVRYITSADANSTVVVRTKGTDNNGVLRKIVIGTTSAHALGIYNGITAASPSILIGTLKASIVEGTYEFDVECSQGIAISVPSGYIGTASIIFD